MNYKTPFYIACGVALIFILIYIFQPNYEKKYLDLKNKPLIEKKVVEVKKFDSLQKELDSMSLKNRTLKDSLDLKRINKSLDSAKANRYDVEKESKSYFNSDFDSKFKLLSTNVKENGLRE